MRSTYEPSPGKSPDIRFQASPADNFHNKIQLSRDSGLPGSTISEVLARKKPFWRQLLRKVTDALHVNVGLFAANI